MLILAIGLLTYAEREIVEVELDEHLNLKLSEAVKITIYSPIGTIDNISMGGVGLVVPKNDEIKVWNKLKYGNEHYMVRLIC